MDSRHPDDKNHPQEIPTRKNPPTQDPQIEPEDEPTRDPQIDPEAEPTRNPKIDPEVEPTRDPNIDPEIDPNEVKPGNSNTDF